MRHAHIHGAHFHEGRRFARGEGGPHGHPGEDHPRFRGGGRSRLGRFFDHGDLRLVILQLIAEKPRHGYDVIKAIEEKAGGAYTPSPGVVYPTLTLLEEVGHITVTAGEGPRKLHTVTPEGQAHLDANRAAVNAIFAKIAGAGPSGGPAPQIMRAMENLKLSLRLRLSRDRLGETELRAITAAIDAAAVAIEQS